MKITNWLGRTVARIVRDVAEAPAVARELRQRRAAQAETARTPAPLSADDIKGTVPDVADIETAARAYEQARTETNAAARTKRNAEKTLKRTPDGQYGTVTVERFESSRQVADMDAIKALLAEHGLGEVPMKTCSASLVLTFAAELAPAGDAAELELVLAAA